MSKNKIKSRKIYEADEEMTPAYNKEATRQYNQRKFNAADADSADFDPEDIESFDETQSPAANMHIGAKTKSEQELSIKALDLSLDVVKLLSGYDLETVFKTAALI